MGFAAEGHAFRKASEQRRRDIVDCGAGSLLDDLGDPLAMAMADIALEAEEAGPCAALDQSDKFRHFLLRFGCPELLLVDLPQRLEVAGPCCRAAFRRRAELLQMQIADTVLVEARRKLPLGEAGLA